jgi:hypothetical protein
VPEEWASHESKEDISCAAFKMRVQIASFYKKFKLKYEYESLKDHVLPSEADAFFSSYKQADDNMEYSLSKATDKATIDSLSENKSKGEQVNIVFVIIIVVVLFGGAVWFTQKRR